MLNKIKSHILGQDFCNKKRQNKTSILAQQKPMLRIFGAQQKPMLLEVRAKQTT